MKSKNSHRFLTNMKEKNFALIQMSVSNGLSYCLVCCYPQKLIPCILKYLYFYGFNLWLVFYHQKILITTFSLFQEHQSTCDMYPVECTNAGCDKTVKRYEKEKVCTLLFLVFLHFKRPLALNLNTKIAEF